MPSEVARFNPRKYFEGKTAELIARDSLYVAGLQNSKPELFTNACPHFFGCPHVETGINQPIIIDLNANVREYSPGPEGQHGQLNPDNCRGQCFNMLQTLPALAGWLIRINRIAGTDYLAKAEEVKKHEINHWLKESRHLANGLEDIPYDEAFDVRMLYELAAYLAPGKVYDIGTIAWAVLKPWKSEDPGISGVSNSQFDIEPRNGFTLDKLMGLLQVNTFIKQHPEFVPIIAELAFENIRLPDFFNAFQQKYEVNFLDAAPNKGLIKTELLPFCERMFFDFDLSAGLLVESVRFISNRVSEESNLLEMYLHLIAGLKHIAANIPVNTMLELVTSRRQYREWSGKLFAELNAAGFSVHPDLQANDSDDRYHLFKEAMYAKGIEWFVGKLSESSIKKKIKILLAAYFENPADPEVLAQLDDHFKKYLEQNKVYFIVDHK